MADDPLTATLKEMLDRAGFEAACTAAPPGTRSCDDATVLVGVVKAVLNAHRPNTADGRCNWCRDPDGQRSVFPCGEYLTIKAALTGKEAGDG